MSQDVKVDNTKKVRSGTLLQDPENEMCSVFISFARQKDKSFVKDMHDHLKHENRSVWLDWEDLPPTSDWLEEVQRRIEAMDCFIFVSTPHSLNHEMCNWEIDHAVKNGKRIVVVQRGDIDYSLLRKDLTYVNTIFFKEDDSNFDDAMKMLCKALDVDFKHAQYHTRILQCAIQWERKDFEKGLLLQKDDLQRAKHWIASSALGKEPKPTTLQLSYITASDSLSTSMKKRKLIAIFFAVIVAIGIIWPSWGVFFFSLIFAHFFVYFASN